ncbi:MAG: alpha/beta fold hydrolase [Deltaproteobacteria bacterium]|nr:alpha/beta fold hydrolase [Deltaproteobacteria bacterium]
MDRTRIRRTEAQLPGARGEILFRREWRGPAPERSLLLVHGLAEHSGRYEHFGTWFAERGCAVHAYDLIGHGRSDGARGHLRKFSDYLDDLEAMLRFVREHEPELPIVLVGHSMGGLVVTTYASERGPEVAGVVTSGAALTLSSDVSPRTVALANALALFLPRIRLDAKVDIDGEGPLRGDSAQRICGLSDPSPDVAVARRGRSHLSGRGQPVDALAARGRSCSAHDVPRAAARNLQ